MTFAGLDKMPEAVRHYRMAIALRPGWRHATNDLAWILATDPDPRLRNPQEAVRLQETVVKVEENQAAMLDTLAAAYAATGRFEDAVRTARKAEITARHRQPQLAAEIRERQALYAAGRPFVDTPAAESGERGGKPDPGLR